jgi:hypothetical protein
MPQPAHMHAEDARQSGLAVVDGEPEGAGGDYKISLDHYLAAPRRRLCARRRPGSGHRRDLGRSRLSPGVTGVG